MFCTRVLGVERNIHILVSNDGEVVPDVKDRPKSGNHELPQTRVDHSIHLATLRNRHITARSLQMRYLGRHGRRVSVQTIRNRLLASQLKSRKAAQKPNTWSNN